MRAKFTGELSNVRRVHPGRWLGRARGRGRHRKSPYSVLVINQRQVVDFALQRIGRGDIARVFPDVIRHAETPLVRTAPAPLYLLSRLTREHGIKGRSKMSKAQLQRAVDRRTGR